MIGFLCATPYHIMAAMTMATGMYSDKKAVLVVMDHASGFDEQFIEKIEGLGIFYKVYLYKSNNKTKLNNIKRLINAFFPPKLVRDLSKMPFENFFCLALNFIDAAYLIKHFEKRGTNCEVAFADDGIGTYVSTTIYKPKKISEIILKLKGNTKYLKKIKRLFVYRPELVVVESGYELVKIEQNDTTAQKLKHAMSVLWPLDTQVDVGGKIVYFEQPYPEGKYDGVVEAEVALLKIVTEESGLEACIKMHPRSNAEATWSDFYIMKSKIPFEAMLLQMESSPMMYMSNCSTALFSSYFLDTLDGAETNTVMLSRVINFLSSAVDNAFAEFVAIINRNFSNGNIYSPNNKDELFKVLSDICKK